MYIIYNAKSIDLQVFDFDKPGYLQNELGCVCVGVWGGAGFFFHWWTGGHPSGQK